jgi:signal transduction histidine kinase
MIIAGRNRGRLLATSKTIGSRRLPRRRDAFEHPSAGTPAASERQDRTACPRALEAERPERRRPTLPGAALRYGAQAVVPLLLLGLALSAFLPWTRFELQETSDQVAVETAATLISAIAAILFFDRFRRHLRLRNLLLAGGLAVVAASNAGAGLLLAGNLLLAGHSVAWIVLGGRLGGWLLIGGSVVVPDRRLRRPRGARPRTALLCAIVGLLPLGLLLAFDSRTASYGKLYGSPLGDPTAMLVVQILLALLTGLAAAGFRREAGRDGSPSAQLLALACAFAAAAALANCATPSFYAARVGVADVLRLGWLIALFACVCVEWSLDERRASAHALERERRRMAADVHDLIMQDLSFALANARTLVEDPEHANRASTIVSAGERALAGARGVLNELREDDSRPIAEAVEASVRAAARHTPLTFRLGGSPVGAAPPDEPTRLALVHIAREAVTNAVKHARPRTIEVVLDRDDEWSLTVRDDGRGFDATTGGEGYGLLSMRRHAEALGGGLRVRSGYGGGTTVEASLP